MTIITALNIYIMMKLGCAKLYRKFKMYKYKHAVKKALKEKEANMRAQFELEEKEKREGIANPG